MSTFPWLRRALYVCTSSVRKIALVFRFVVSASRKKSEYDDIEAVEDVENEEIDSGDEDNDVSEALELGRVSWGKRMAMVPPNVGRLLSPHIVNYRSEDENVEKKCNGTVFIYK
jgi:hypothetical protein